MNDIVSPKVLVVAGSRPKQFDDHILPAMNGLGLTVVRVVSPTYRGSLEDIDAVLLMFQFCGREQYTALRSQCNTAKVKFIILPQQTAGWLTTFAEHALRVPGKPVYARPLPVPPTPIVHPKAEACEAQEPEEVGNEPDHATFGQALHLARRAGRHSQVDVAAVCDVEQSMVSRWELGSPLQRDHYEKLLELFPVLKTAAVPQFATRSGPGKRKSGTNGAHVAVGGVSVTTFAPRPDVEVRDTRKTPTPPVAVIVPSMAHAARPLPLDGLRRAARALGVTGPIAVIVDDGASKVTAGDLTWHGTGPDEAVETARAALDKRLRDLRTEMEAKRIEMEAALCALGAA